MSIHAELGFGIGFFAIREFSCDIPVETGHRGVTMATDFGTKIDINAYK